MFLGLSLFFTFNVISFKNKLNVSSKDLKIDSGQKVTVVRIIDGDEISVKLDNNQFIVRLLGISSFNPTINDPSIQNVAQNALIYLEKNLLNKEVTVVFDNFVKDEENRLISYLAQNGRDIGLDMVDSGYTLVYTKYKFSRMHEYLKHENAAMLAKQGLWGNPVITQRSIQLKKIWEQSKRD